MALFPCLAQAFEVIDDYPYTGTPYLPSDSTDSQVRGLGSMVAFWERMRNICPKTNIYNGPILQSDGSQCVTSNDLDRAMLATRAFWFEDPISSHSEWDCVLDLYADTQEWPDIELPSKQMLLDTLLHTKDSAPGPDGLPYAAWRLLPEVTVDAMMSYFYDILDETALPPLQVGVWIPKAKMGPEADNFRPLGMPNTLERLVDGTAAAQVMRATAPNMHPSQTVMSMFKEPQRAVTGIQNLLDSDRATCSLLADLSKAFERVNPHWILKLLRIKRAPKWVITYAKFILFHRRVTHKVQGRLLPSRTILQGVDMGRSFSVFLFCFAMDPLFHYLNRIPSVLAVEAYVDDTTIIGDAQSLEWMKKVSDTYQKVRTAGFIVDSHTCYRALQNSVMRFAPKKLTDEELLAQWPDILVSKSYSTVQDAMQDNCCPGYNTLIVRLARFRLRSSMNESRQCETVADHLVVNYNFCQVQDVLQGQHFHTVGVFATSTCSCKSKSQVVTNFALRPAALSHLEQSGYGIHAIAPCAPSLGLALTGRVMFNEEGTWQDTQDLETLYDIKPAPFQKFSQRLQLFRAPTLSIVARCTCFNTYIVSVNTASYFGLSTSDLNLLRQQAVKFLLKRHWLESEILPYVLRYIGIAPVLDPALVATVAATGLYFREGNTLEDLININLLPEGCNLRQRSVVHDLLQFWAPSVKLPEIYAALANKGGGLKGRLTRLKCTIYQGMAIAAKACLRRKIIEEGWSRGITPEWVEITSSLKKKWCNGVARYTILRWAVNQDDDVWLARRGTRHSQQCSMCSSKGDRFLPSRTWGCSHV